MVGIHSCRALLVELCCMFDGGGWTPKKCPTADLKKILVNFF